MLDMSTEDVNDDLCSPLAHRQNLSAGDSSYWKEMYETERDENNKQLNERLEQSKKGVANALMFALSVSDDENGNLVISKENRKSLAENLKWAVM